LPALSERSPWKPDDPRCGVGDLDLALVGPEDDDKVVSINVGDGGEEDVPELIEPGLDPTGGEAESLRCLCDSKEGAAPPRDEAQIP